MTAHSVSKKPESPPKGFTEPFLKKIPRPNEGRYEIGEQVGGQPSGQRVRALANNIIFLWAYRHRNGKTSAFQSNCN